MEISPVGWWCKGGEHSSSLSVACSWWHGSASVADVTSVCELPEQSKKLSGKIFQKTARGPTCCQGVCWALCSLLSSRGQTGQTVYIFLAIYQFT